MILLTYALLAIALVAAVFGFGPGASYAPAGAKIVCAVALILAALSYLGGTFGRQALRRRSFWEYYGEQHLRTANAARTRRRRQTAREPSSVKRLPRPLNEGEKLRARRPSIAPGAANALNPGGIREDDKRE